MFYLRLYDRYGRIEYRACRSLAYAKREADLLRLEPDVTRCIEKIEICRRQPDGENENEQIIEAFYFK